MRLGVLPVPFPCRQPAASGSICIDASSSDVMKVVLVFFAWCILLVLCWPLAILALLLAPLVWIVALPFRLAGVCLGAVLAFVRALLYLPARLLGPHPRSTASR